MSSPLSGQAWGGPLAAPFRLPLERAYGLIASHRFRNATPARIDCPVICVGNPTVGGAGKTPTAIALAEAARRVGFSPGFVTRGYGRRGGRRRLLVDPATHGVREAGDEALLLAETAPTAVDAGRLQGAQLLRDAGCNLVIMDDGFQSRRLHSDVALLLVDRTAGVGNGRMLPAGPLRLGLREQIAAADTLVVVDSGGPMGASDVLRAASRAGRRVVHASIVLVDGERLAGRRVVAFSGLGDPAKFARSLERAGATIAARWDFADHHVFTKPDLDALARLSREHDAPLVTTAKDEVRLRSVGADLAVEVVRMRVDLEAGAAEGIVERAARRFSRRRSGRS